MRWTSSLLGLSGLAGLSAVIVASLPASHATAVQPVATDPAQATAPSTPATTDTQTTAAARAAADRRAGATRLLQDAGLSTSALCAAGVTTAEISAIAVNADAFFQSYQVPLRATALALQQRRAATSVRSALAAAGVDGGTTDSQTSAESPRALLEAARVQHESLLNSAFEAITSGLPADKRTALANIRANRRYNLPIHFLVVQRTSTEWAILRRSLEHTAAKRRAGQQPDAQAAATVSAAQADPAVAAAKQRLTQSLTPTRDSVRAAIQSTGN